MGQHTSDKSLVIELHRLGGHQIVDVPERPFQIINTDGGERNPRLHVKS